MKTLAVLFLAWRLVFAAVLGSMTATSAHAVNDDVVVVSPHWDGIKEETARAFSAWHEQKYGTRATIHWRQTGGGSSQIARFLRAEYQTNSSSGVDVLYGGGVDLFIDLEKDGLLTKYDPPADVIAQIPAQLNGLPIYDQGHFWFGAAMSGFGILTNERARAAVGLPPARTWADLADPRLAGWISASDPRASGSALAVYEIILQAYGWEKGWGTLMAFSGNVRSFFGSAAASSVEVGVGDAAYGVAIDTYGEAQAAFYGPGNVSFVLPVGQTAITPDSIAILKNPPHLEIARHFLEFVLSRSGQLLWMEPKGSPGGAVRYDINRMTVWPALYNDLAGVTPVVTDPFTATSAFVYSDQLGSRRRAILSVLIAAWMIDTHDALVPAWKALHSPAMQKFSSTEQQELLAEFLTPPFSESELLRLAGNDWKNPVRRTALVNRWQTDALVRYKSLLAKIAAR